MKIDERFELRLVVLENRDEMTGDCYDSFLEFRRNHPYSGYIFAYIIYDTHEDEMAEDSKDWYDTPEDALNDYFTKYFNLNSQAVKNIMC